MFFPTLILSALAAISTAAPTPTPQTPTPAPGGPGPYTNGTSSTLSYNYFSGANTCSGSNTTGTVTERQCTFVEFAGDVGAIGWGNFTEGTDVPPSGFYPSQCYLDIWHAENCSGNATSSLYLDENGLAGHCSSITGAWSMMVVCGQVEEPLKR